MYRLTGEGIYRDSALLGIPTPLQHPDIDSQVSLHAMQCMMRLAYVLR